ncbi:hypothetical protein INR49_014505 [Caranx melampygus]|nr:hypothetical protein INR49_014505 [Caranx melampygus]
MRERKESVGAEEAAVSLVFMLRLGNGTYADYIIFTHQLEKRAQQMGPLLITTSTCSKGESGGLRQHTHRAATHGFTQMHYIPAARAITVDDLWVWVVEEKNETWQTALVFYYGSSVQGVCSEISQLVYHNVRFVMMPLAFGSAKPYGSSRSIVRRIATSLPLKPCPRVHFQLHPYTEEASVLQGVRRQNCQVASLADIGQIDRDEEDDGEEFFGRPW